MGTLNDNPGLVRCQLLGNIVHYQMVQFRSGALGFLSDQRVSGLFFFRVTFQISIDLEIQKRQLQVCVRTVHMHMHYYNVI